jgi:hypothetical protein
VLDRGGPARAALAGVDVVIDALNIATQSARRATEFFTSTSRSLLEAEERAGAAHHIVLSIVGIDAADAAYYAGKLAQERLVGASAQPHTIARAAQFHEFAGQISAQTSLGPFTLAPRMLSRPVAAREVAEHLVDIAEDGPARRAADLVGPEDHTLAAMIRRQNAHDGISRRVLEMRLPGTYWRGLASGALRGDPADRADRRDDLRGVAGLGGPPALSGSQPRGPATPGAGGELVQRLGRRLPAHARIGHRAAAHQSGRPDLGVQGLGALDEVALEHDAGERGAV